MKLLPLLFLCLVMMAYANLPHRVNVLKQKKNQTIYSALKVVYKDYTDSLLNLQTELVASNRLTDSNIVQSEFFLNTGYFDFIGKNYQFVFDRPRSLPFEAKVFRETRNEKVKIALRRSLTKYIEELKSTQAFYMKNKNFVDARKATDEMSLATFELSKIETIDSGTTSVAPLPSSGYLPKIKSFNLGNGVPLEMIYCRPGSFIMGSPEIEPERAPDEFQKNVSIKKGFYLGKYEITQSQYEIIMKGNSSRIDPRPSHFANQPNHPVENISLHEIEIFMQRLNNHLKDHVEIKMGLRFTLPNEEEWEYACRAGTKTAYSFGPNITSFNANYNLEKDLGATKPVGSYPANNWGFHDMHGNVWEKTSTTFKNTKTSGESFVRKGGSWWSKSINTRSARRLRYTRTLRHMDIGFRICLK